MEIKCISTEHIYRAFEVVDILSQSEITLKDFYKDGCIVQFLVSKKTKTDIRILRERFYTLCKDFKIVNDDYVGIITANSPSGKNDIRFYVI